MPATWHGIFNMHMLIEVSRILILEGAGARHAACPLKFGCPHQDLPTEEEKKQEIKHSKETTKTKSNEDVFLNLISRAFR